MNINPGQIWLSDKDFKYNEGYDGEIAYVVKSKEPNEAWVLIAFQEWGFGGHERHLEDDAINQMKYIGHIKDVK